MDGPALVGLVNLSLLVDGLTQEVKYAAQALLAHRHADRRAGINRFRAALQAVCGAHGDAANHVVADVLRDLGHDLPVAMLDFNGAQQIGQLIIGKANIQNRAHDLDHRSNILSHMASTPSYH